jgi:membrane protein
LTVLLSIGFSFFIAQLNTYNRLYGSLGTLMLLLVWVNANSAVLLLGFELDASIEKARREALERFSDTKG